MVKKKTSGVLIYEDLSRKLDLELVLALEHRSTDLVLMYVWQGLFSEFSTS